MNDLTAAIATGHDLDETQVESAVGALVSDEVDGSEKAGFLRALRSKGETAGEIAAFVKALLRRAVDPEIDRSRLSGPLLDVCGTGGDKMDLFNVSTTVMFVAAAGGAVVAKHGNRAITSLCGGADVLEELGAPIHLSPADLRACLEQTGMGFMFAPDYHPAFKAIAPVRKSLAAEGLTTIFNMLGPLLNPALPDYQLVGVFSESILPKFPGAFRLLGRKRAWVVNGRTADDRSVDELSTMGPTRIRTMEDELELEITPEEFGLARVPVEELRGGDRAQNAAITRGILAGEIGGARRDVVALNAAAAFVVTGLAIDIPAGLALAEEQLESGRALKKLHDLQDFTAG